MRQLGAQGQPPSMTAPVNERRNAAALPERRVTLHTGDMGNTFSLCGREPCPGRSVMSWKNVSDSLRDGAVGGGDSESPGRRSTGCTRAIAR